MSKEKDKIEVSVSAVRGIIPCLEGQVASLDEQIAALTRERSERARVLAEVKAKLSGKESRERESGSGKRLKKGEAERIIVELLEYLPNGKRGLTIQEVVEQSGVPYSSVFRILNQNKNGHFDNPEGLWQLRKR